MLDRRRPTSRCSACSATRTGRRTPTTRASSSGPASTTTSVYRFDPEAEAPRRARGQLRRDRRDQLRRGAVRLAVRRSGAVLSRATCGRRRRLTPRPAPAAAGDRRARRRRLHPRRHRRQRAGPDQRPSSTAGRASWPAAMAAKGLGLGDRLALGLRNSPELFIAAFAGWKVGATPIPVRWDLPDWELDQLREVIGARVHLGDDDLAVDPRPPPTPRSRTSPTSCRPRMHGHLQQRIDRERRRSSSARCPAVYNEVFSTPMMEQWRPVRAAPDRCWCWRRCTTSTPSPRSTTCWPATGWSCSSGSTPPGPSTPSSATGSPPSRPRRRCCSASPTSPASTTATCRASTGSCRARPRCRRRSSTGGPA